MKTPWQIRDIARRGGLSKLNPKQRRYVRTALHRMLDHGGTIHEHRCHTNARVLPLIDFLYGDGRILGYSGTVNRGTSHGWCEIDDTPFDMSYPLEIGFEREIREFTLEQMRNYKKEDKYDYSQRPFEKSMSDIIEMLDRRNCNLSPEAAKVIAADLIIKRNWSVNESFVTDLINFHR